MASIDYPCRLPGVLVNSNAYSSKSRVRRNSLESGPPVYVLEDDDGYEMFDVSWAFNASEVQIFRNWYRHITVSGSKLFNIDLMVDGWDGERQTKTHECYFDSVPSYTQNGRRWLVTATLLAIEEQIMDECDGITLVSAYTAFDYDDLNDAFSDVDNATQSLISAWDTTPPNIGCVSTQLDDSYWNNGGDPFFNGIWNSPQIRWEIQEQTNSGAQRILTNNPVPSWALGFRPNKLYITAYASSNDEVTFNVSNCTAQKVPGGLVDLETFPKLFEFDLSDYTGDIDEMGFGDVSATTVYIDCIEFTTV